MDASYNDIATWDNQSLVDVFGGRGQAKTFKVRTKDELNALLLKSDFQAARELQFVEIHMPKKDAPRALVTTAEASARTNAKRE